VSSGSVSDGEAGGFNDLRQTLRAKLAQLQNELLDLSRRNRLLNFRGDKGASSLRIVDELGPEIFRLLVTERRNLHFLAREEAPKELAAALPREDEGGAGIGIPLAPLDGGAVADRHRDNALQTALAGEPLQTRLTRLAQQARSSYDEHGANILYLTLGMVSWRETTSSEVSSNAPLLLVPVELDRKSVNSRYTVRLLDEDVVANPCLLELTKRVFDASLPAPELNDEFDFKAYLLDVQAAVTPLGWRVTDEIHLGLFSFSKLLMYRDLQAELWPTDASIVDHPMVRRLLGVEGDAANEDVRARDPSELDEVFHPSNVFQVMDADSSQQVAIAAARDGASAVIEGPPGTGKSQTITNIIAECLSQGKRVLFVAEKAAALEVVQRRLESVGLGDFVLELHSRKTSKAAVLAELQRCLMPSQQEAGSHDVDPDELARLRAKANAYVRELHVRRSGLDLSAYEAMSHVARFGTTVKADFAVPNIRSWSMAMLSDARERIALLDARLGRVGEPSTHPWRAARLTRLGPDAKQKIRSQLKTVRDALAGIRSASVHLAPLIGQAAPRSLRECVDLANWASTIADSPPELTESNWNDQRWGPEGGLDSLIADGEARSDLLPRWAQVFSANAELAQWTDVLARRSEGPGLFRWLGATWRADTQRLRAATTSGQLPSRPELVGALGALTKSASLRISIEKRGPGLADLLTSTWRGVETDWRALETGVRGARQIQRLAGEKGLSADGTSRCLRERSEARRAAERVRAAGQAFREAWKAWTEATASTDGAWFEQTSLGEIDLDVVAAALEQVDRRFAELDDWVAYTAIVSEVSAGFLEPAATWAVSPAGAPARGRLAEVFERRIYELWIEGAIDESPILADFHGEDHAVTLERFQELDRLWIEATRTRVGRTLRAQRPEMSGTARRGSKLAVVEAEIRKKRRHLPLRRLLREAGEVVQAIKPCFMMSPISVAQYLAPGDVNFDVVIFDEASQVEPADAFGAIARARQVIFVGDEKQLPPTNFFMKVESDVPATSDDDESPENDVGKDMESILGLGMVRMPHRFSLRWHYRSAHESLISFSNEKFYDNLLRVFPSAHTGRQDVGVQWRYVGGRYERGAGKINLDEVRAIVDEVVAHARVNPKKSLGVGTFNSPQQMAIEDELERRRRGVRDEALEAFLSAEGSEPFFIKNLETIQGDERDTILLSVTYGPDATGRVFRNFGPLNREGGWRRMNVLVTRARERCVVFSSLHADEIQLGENAPRGVVAFKDYLHFAEYGAMPTSAIPAGGFDSPLEEEIANALRRKGWEVRSQIGVAGFWIDLAIVDPERRGRYLVGIECDGATYHSSPTARDRDRLRQGVLEKLGWRLLRVWSTDWFKNPERALERLLVAIDDVKSGAPRVARAASPIRRLAPVASRAAEAEAQYDPRSPAGRSKSRDVERYVRHAVRVNGQGMTDTAAVVPALIDLVRIEGPIHVEEAGRVLCRALGTRLTESNSDALEVAIAAAIEAQALERKGGFLRIPGAATVVRHRGGTCEVTKPELIPPEEYAEAIRLVLKKEFGLHPDALHTSVVRLMGFERAGERLKDEISRGIRRLLDDGDIKVDGRGYVVMIDAR
jgi:very-short-patch-repair endonuclease